MNFEGPNLAEELLHNLCPCFDIVFASLGIIARKHNKIVEIVAVSECYLIINPFKKSGIKKAAVPNIPSRKTSWPKNVNGKGKKFLVPNLQCYQFQQDDWKKRVFSGKISLTCTCGKISRKFRLLRKSAAILSDVK